MAAFGLPIAFALASLVSFEPSLIAPTSDAWQLARWGGVRGVTIGPIENLRHPDRGYGSAASARALDEAVAMGATWVSITPFGRVWNLTPRGIDYSFEAPFAENRNAVGRFVEMAHARGLRVMVVPHLWVESGEWRALIDPGTTEDWNRWTNDYRKFVLAWAELSARTKVDVFSVGVELRSWVTTSRVSSMVSLVHEVRSVYPGLVTYSANWDDAADTLFWDEVDLIGINAFYPLTDKEGAGFSTLLTGAQKVATEVGTLAEGARKPVLLTEVGYTTRRDPAVHPWEWPESMSGVVIDEQAQRDAYAALLAPFVDASWCAGFFVWRLYADPDDVSQEPEYGFSPRGKLAELVLRDAFHTRFASEGPPLPGDFAGRHRARTPGVYAWDASPPLFDE